MQPARSEFVLVVADLAISEFKPRLPELRCPITFGFQERVSRRLVDTSQPILNAVKLFSIFFVLFKFECLTILLVQEGFSGVPLKNS